MVKFCFMCVLSQLEKSVKGTSFNIRYGGWERIGSLRASWLGRGWLYYWKNWVCMKRRRGFPGLLSSQESACCAADIGTQVWFLNCKDNLEEEVATHSSILAWKAPWTEEPGGIWFMGWLRVGHDWRDWALSTDEEEQFGVKTLIVWWSAPSLLFPSISALL